MVLIVGGRSQGKVDFAKSLFPEIKKENIGDGRTAEPAELMSCSVLTHFESLVKRLLSEGKKPEEWMEGYLKVCPKAVIISDEIGGGVIPMDNFEEEWRETTGRLLCDLARRSESFYRVICGYGLKIK